MILSILTFIHLAFCLLALGAGIKVMSGLFAGELIEKWGVAFFRCALTASVTGLLMSFYHLSSSHWISMSSVYVSGAAILVWRKYHLDGIWRSICAFCIPIVLCLNILLVTAQAFRLIPVLRALSPMQSEPVFLVSQISVLILFAVLGLISAKRFRNRTN